MTQKVVVFVLGVGRSGTSALTRALSLCGANLPEPLLGTNAGNPKGHFEPAEALAANDAFLIQNGSKFHDPSLRLQNEIIIDDQKREKFVEKIAALLDIWPADGVLVVKDPRITIVSDYWFEAAHRREFSVKTIIMVRHPEEVAASFAARDHISKNLSSALWLKYNLIAERGTRLLPRVFVEYTKLLSDWRTEIARISDSLSISLLPPSGNEVDDFFSRDLYRQRYSGASANEQLDPWTQYVHGAFSGASRGMALDLSKLDEIYSQYTACEKMFRESWAEFQTGFATGPQSPTRTNWDESEYRSHQDIPPDFNAQVYLELNLDVLRANTDPYRHYVEFGKREGRMVNHSPANKQASIG